MKVNGVGNERRAVCVYAAQGMVGVSGSRIAKQ